MDCMVVHGLYGSNMFDIFVWNARFDVLIDALEFYAVDVSCDGERYIYIYMCIE